MFKEQFNILGNTYSLKCQKLDETIDPTFVFIFKIQIKKFRDAAEDRASFQSLRHAKLTFSWLQLHISHIDLALILSSNSWRESE